MADSKNNNDENMKKYMFGFVVVTGFVTGVVFTTTPDTFFEAPAKSLFCSILGGISGMISTGIMAKNFGENLQVFLPLIEIGLMLNYLQKK